MFDHLQRIEWPPVLRDRDVAIHDVTRRVIALDVAEYPIVRANQGKLLIRLSQVVSLREVEAFS